MISNEITEKLQVHACYHRTYIPLYRCQLKSFFSKQLKFERIFFPACVQQQQTEAVRRVEVKVFKVEIIVTKKVTVPVALGHKCKKSYRELVLKRGSVKMHMFGKLRCQMGPRWIFFTDGQFLPIPRELVFIIDKITYYICLICRGRQRERQRQRLRPLEENFVSEKFQGFFFTFRHFFPMNCFPDQNHLSSTKKSPC